ESRQPVGDAHHVADRLREPKGRLRAVARRVEPAEPERELGGEHETPRLEPGEVDRGRCGRALLRELERLVETTLRRGQAREDGERGRPVEAARVECEASFRELAG